MTRPVWAVVRLDNYLEHLFVEGPKTETPAESLLAVVRVLLSPERAEQEVARLSSLAAARGGNYFAKATEAFPSASFVRPSPLVALVRLADFDPAHPTTPNQVTVVGIFGSEDEANAERDRSPAEQRAEYAVFTTRFAN